MILFGAGGPATGPMEMIVFGIVALLVAAGGASKYVAVPRLVLTGFQIAPQGSPRSDEFFSLKGRRAGLLGFIVSTLGLDNIVTLGITPNHAEYRLSSLSGKSVSHFPLASVTAVVSTLKKPIQYLMLAGFGVCAGLYQLAFGQSSISAVIFLIISGVLVLAFFLGKSIALELHNGGGQSMALQFYPSVIEGVRVDLVQAEAAVALIGRYVQRALQSQVAQQIQVIPQSSPIQSAVMTPVAAPIAVAMPTEAPPVYDRNADHEAQFALTRLREGVSAHKAGSIQEATVIFADVVRRYPGTPAAKKAREFADQLRAEGF